MAACTEVFGRWGVTYQSAGGELPVPGVYGVPEQWPHIAALYRRAGFSHTGHTEVVYLAPVEDLPKPGGPPLDGLAVRRSVGINGCRLSAETVAIRSKLSMINQAPFPAAAATERYPRGTGIQRPSRGRGQAV